MARHKFYMCLPLPPVRTHYPRRFRKNYKTAWITPAKILLTQCKRIEVRTLIVIIETFFTLDNFDNSLSNRKCNNFPCGTKHDSRYREGNNFRSSKPTCKIESCKESDGVIYCLSKQCRKDKSRW